jgi:hypothetical protein
MKGIPNMGNLLKQAQQFQAKLAKLQEELAGRTVEATSGGGMVSVVANGRQEVISIKIDPEVIDREDKEMLQDLILAAVNDALSKAKAMMNEEMGKLTHGLNLPNIPGLM